MAGGPKSASAFRTISEVSKELDLPQHVLRFWETRFHQIRPLKRGGGRRYYRPEDLDILRQIRGLLYDNGYTIKGVQKLLKDGTAKLESSGKQPNTPETAENSVDKLPQNTNAELHAILSELQEIQGILRNWA